MTRRRVALVLIAVLAAVTAGAMRQLDIGRELELETVDVRFKIRGPLAPPDDVVLVQVDERTLSDLKLRWPFPRSRHARVLDRLDAAGARVIAIDLQFTERTDTDEDNALVLASGGPGRSSSGPPWSTTRAGRTCSAATRSSTASARASAAA